MQNLGRAFGTLYYAIPITPPHQRLVKGRKVRMSEHVIGVLWMIDLIQQEHQSCFQSVLATYLKEWWPSKNDKHDDDESRRPKRKPAKMTRLSVVLGQLTKAGFIRSERYMADRREHTIRLTADGRKFLRRIQLQRLRYLEKNLGVSKDLVKKLDALANEIADAIWKKRRDSIQDSALARQSAKKRTASGKQHSEHRPASARHR